MKPVIKHVVLTSVVLFAGAIAAAAIFIWSGVYNIAADDPHTAPVYALLTTLREHSMEARAEKIVVPDLSDPAQIAKGAGNYAAMCSGCHLSPGVNESEISKGLYPQPPNLSREKVEPEHAYWAIKHGIKASGMPAWGGSMDDASMWSLAAFLQKLPTLDKAAYGEMVEHSGGHSHGGGEEAEGPRHHEHGMGADAHHEAAEHDGAGHANHDHDHDQDHDHAAPAAADTAGPAGSASAPVAKPAPTAHIHADGKRHEHPVK